MTEEFDPFSLATGLLDDFVWEIRSATFALDTTYSDTPYCEIEGTTDDASVPNFSKRYGCGKGWEVTQHGRVITGKSRFVKSSGMGLFIGAAMETGAADELRKRLKDHPEGPMDASIWDGMKFRMKSREISYGGEIGKKDVILPAEFLGVVGGTTAKASTNGNGKVDAALIEELKALAGKSGSYDEFVSAAFQVDGVDGNNAVEDLIMDQSDGGLYATASA